MRARPLLSIFLIVFVDLVGFGVVIPLLPLYARDLQAGGLEVGLLITCFSLGQFLAAPYLGAISDRVGRRPVLALSLAMAAVSYVIFGLAESLWLLFLSRSIAGICGGNIAAAQAYIADVSSLENRARAMGMIGAAFGLGFVLGPAIGGLFAEISPSAPFFFAAGMSGLAMVLCLTWLSEPDQRQKSTGQKRNLALLRDERLRILVVCFFVSTFAFTHLETVFSLYNTWRFDLTAAQNSFLFTYIGVILVTVQGGVIGPVTRRLGSRTVLMLGIGLMSVGLVSLPMAPSVPLLLLALLPTSVGSGLTTPSLLALISRVAIEGHQGQTQGLGQSASGLARIVGPISAGALYEHVSQGSAFLIAGAGMLIALLFAGRSDRNTNPAPLDLVSATNAEGNQRRA